MWIDICMLYVGTKMHKISLPVMDIVCRYDWDQYVTRNGIGVEGIVTYLFYKTTKHIGRLAEVF